MENDLYAGLELKAEVKELKEDGTFTGIASVYGVEDLTGDVIDKGAFKKTLAENPEVLVLWQHRPDEAIGGGMVKEWQNKILIEGQLDIADDPTAQKAYRKMKAGRTKGLSIGFKTIKATWEEIEEDGRMRYVRHIQELKLYEVSVVTFPALPAAQVTRVKSEEQDLQKRVAELEAKIQALQAPSVKTEGTPPVEPPRAAEPPSQSTEPEFDHSLLESLITTLKGA